MADMTTQSLSPLGLIARACASIEFGSSLLTQAAADLSSATASLRQEIKRRPRRKRLTLLNTSESYAGVLKRSRRPTASPYFPEPEKKSKQKATQTSTISPFFPEPFSREPTPTGLSFRLQPVEFGLIQERICESLFALVVQAILWNKTKGAAARPILWKILCTYSTPESLASADPVALQDAIRVLGLQERRAQCLMKMAGAWVAAPPCPERRYARRNYPKKGSNRDVKDRELLGPDDEREGWEIGHLPGVGEYALDSYRIFGRDRLRGIQGDEKVESEWKRVVPSDKELGPYVKYKWAKEGWEYDLSTGRRIKLTQ